MNLRNLLILLCLTLLTACSKPADEASPASAQPLESKLAALDKEGPVAAGDPILVQFRNVLEQLSRKFTESREQMGDLTYEAKKELKAENMPQSMITILEGINTAAPQLASSEKFRYSQWLARYLSLRRAGHSHEKAVYALGSSMRENR